jgi:hypothetical protein
MTHLVLIFLVDKLNTELPLGVRPGFNGVVKIPSVEVRILTCQLQGLVPNKGVCTKMRCPVEFDKGALALVVDQTEGVNCAKSALGTEGLPPLLQPHAQTLAVCADVQPAPACSASCPPLLSPLYHRNEYSPPNPCIIRNDRGIARSDRIHICICVDCSCSDIKSQALSCALCACGISLWGSGLTA